MKYGAKRLFVATLAWCGFVPACASLMKNQGLRRARSTRTVVRLLNVSCFLIGLAVAQSAAALQLCDTGGVYLSIPPGYECSTSGVSCVGPHIGPWNEFAAAPTEPFTPCPTTPGQGGIWPTEKLLKDK